MIEHRGIKHTADCVLRRLMFFEQAREQAEREYKANNKDSLVCI